MTGGADSKIDWRRTEIITRCPLCGTEESESILRTFDRYFRQPGEFALERCIDCKLVRLSPRPASQSIAYYYPENQYYSYQTPTSSIQTIFIRPRLHKLRADIRNSVLDAMGYRVPHLALWQRILQPVFLRTLRKPALYGFSHCFPQFTGGGCALDIGSGNASFLSYLKYHGWHVQGLDISTKAAETAKRVFDIDVRVGPLENAFFEENTFDFIRMSHVIEHLTEPVLAMRQVVQWLRPGGLLYVETPNLASVGYRICGPYWFPLESPRHLYLFTPQTACRLLTNVGFEVTSIRSKLFDNLYSWKDTYEAEEVQQRLLESRPHLRLRALPRTVLFGAITQIAHWINQLNGDILCIWARRG